jgi:succinoglycan biosynthesis transport protein ExoP
MISGEAEGIQPGQSETTPSVRKTAESISENLPESLWRRRWTILLTTVLMLAAAFVYLQRATPLYTSTSRIYVEQAGPRAFERDASGVITRWSTYLFTQAELLRGTETLSAALKSPVMARLQSLAQANNPVAVLRRDLGVEVGKKDEIIDVSFTCPYPEEAATIVNTVVDAYITAHNKRKSSLSAEVVKILQEERTKRDKELQKKRQNILDFELQNEGLVYGTDRDSNLVVRTLERLRQALTEAELATLDSKSFLETCRKMIDNPSKLREYVEAQRFRNTYMVATSQTVVLRGDLQRLERERADVLQRLKPDTPAIAALDAGIERIRQQILEADKEFAVTQLLVAEEQFAAAQQKQAELEAHFDQQRQKAVALNTQLAQYEVLQSDYERTKSFCDILDDRIRVLNVDPQMGSLNVEIIEAAEPSALPSRPQRGRTMAMAFSLGLFAGVGIALQREWRDQRLRSTQEISDLLGLPILGTVPSMTSPKQTPAMRGQRVRIDPESREAEAFRTVRTAMFYRAPKEKVHTILITSPATGEGKSTVASNLAITIASTSQRVVIVDADLRRPRQHVLFGMDPTTNGLTSFLAGQVTLQEAIKPTGIENLSILTCGPTVSNPAEIINSDNFTRLVRRLAEEYDRVIIDSPPVTVLADAQILAGLCDATILVVRAQASTRRVSLQAHNTLAGLEARILGVVVNDVPLKGDRYGYYGGYGYGYYGGHRDSNDGKRMRRRTVRNRQETA